MPLKAKTGRKSHYLNVFKCFFQCFQPRNYGVFHLLNFFLWVTRLGVMQFIICGVVESIPAFEKQPSLSAPYQMLKSHSRIKQTSTAISPEAKELFFSCQPYKPLNQGKHYIFDFQFF